MPDKSYTIHARFLVKDEGWKHVETIFDGSYEAAGREASKQARELDLTYGDDHFWTVDLKTPEGGSYFQLFHGRLS